MTISDHDHRPLIKDLLVKHSDEISGVHDAIENDLECQEIFMEDTALTKRYDDIWILRYVLSHKGNVKSASKAAIKTIKFRNEKKLNDLGDIRHRLLNNGMGDNPCNDLEPLPGYTLFEKFCQKDANFITLPDKNRGIVMYCDVGKIDMDGIAEAMNEDEMMEFILHLNEALFQVLDDITRRTGRLTKQFKIIDMVNVSLRKMNRTYLKRDGACNKALEDYYPQLLGTLFVANSPSWLNAVWTTLRPFFPKRFVEKVDFLPPLSKIHKYPDKYLKPILKYVSKENLPERYGGQNKEWPLPAAGLQFSS